MALGCSSFAGAFDGPAVAVALYVGCTLEGRFSWADGCASLGPRLGGPTEGPATGASPAVE